MRRTWPLDSNYEATYDGRWMMAGSGEHFKALVRSHASGDDEAFTPLRSKSQLRPLARVTTLAADLKAAVENSRAKRPKKVT